MELTISYQIYIVLWMWIQSLCVTLEPFDRNMSIVLPFDHIVTRMAMDEILIPAKPVDMTNLALCGRQSRICVLLFHERSSTNFVMQIARQDMCYWFQQIKLRMEIGTVSKRQQSEQRAERRQKAPMVKLYVEKKNQTQNAVTCSTMHTFIYCKH